MKKKTKLSLILSSLAIMAVAGATMAGGTYALFTSESKVNIAVNSGKVEVVATIDDFKTYSGKELTGVVDDDKLEETTVKGTFTNGGTAKLEEDYKTLTLDKMTPGDKVTFKIIVKNNSNVGVKYRTRISLSKDTGLYDGLSVKIGEFEGLSVTDWDSLAVGSTDKELNCEVSLPSDKGNTYQDTSCKLSFSVEAVQGNAVVDYVTIGGIADVKDKLYYTVGEAYNEIKTKLEEKCGLGEQTMSASDFNAFFTDGGKITWNIHGYQKVVDTMMFSFGRAASRFGDNLNITEIIIKGVGDDAELDLSAVDGTFTLPYNWWDGNTINTAIKCSNVTFNSIKSMPGNAYQNKSVDTVYKFDGCTFNGNLYSYQNYKVDMTIKNSTFNAISKTQYAFMAQGPSGKITLDGNTFNDYTRGINLQRPETDFIVTNNKIISTQSESDRQAIQLTDGKSFVVNNNTINVNAGNAFCFHSAATNSSVTYKINNNDINAPYIGYYATSFDVNPKITSSGNKFNSTNTMMCMKKDANAPEATNLTAIK